MEELLVAHGASIVQEPMHSTWAVIASAKKTVKLRNLERIGQWNIVVYTWVLDCVRAGRLIDLEPQHMIFTNDAQRERFKVDIDSFGDRYVAVSFVAVASAVSQLCSMQLHSRCDGIGIDAHYGASDAV